MNPILVFLLGLLVGLGIAICGFLLRRASSPVPAMEMERDWTPLMEAVHDGLILFRDGRIHAANRRANIVLGLDAEAPPERLRYALQRVPELRDFVERLPGTPDVTGTTITLGYPDPRHLRVYAARVAKEGETSGGWFLLTLTDVTELQRLERIRRRFTADISHQIRTPVTAIRLLAEQLPDAEGAFGELSTRILRETDRLQRLAHEILQLARLEAGEEISDVQTFRVGDLVAEAIDTVHSQAGQRGISFRTCGSVEAVWQGDYRKLLRTLEIYLDNAIKFSPAGATVTIGVEDSANKRTLTVRDQGPGIPFDDQPRVFNRFYRGAPGSQHDGFGLGLAIAKHSMAAAGGTVFVESRLGEGSTFGLSLPGADPGIAPPCDGEKREYTGG